MGSKRGGERVVGGSLPVDVVLVDNGLFVAVGARQLSRDVSSINKVLLALPASCFTLPATSLENAVESSAPLRMVGSGSNFAVRARVQGKKRIDEARSELLERCIVMNILLRSYWERICV